MKIFVFGAGASQAAQNQTTYTNEHQERSPLANDLFNEQYQAALTEGLTFDVQECRDHAKSIGLEEWLTQRWRSIESLHTERARHSERSWFGNINLYIWNLLNTVSRTYPNAQGYSPLLQKLYDTEFGIISFNYDTLLDQSYQDIFRSTLSDKNKYLDANFVKLHGSTNWFLKRRDGDKDFGYNRHQNDTSSRVREIAENIYNGSPMSLNKLEIIEPKHVTLANITTVMNYFQSDGYFYPLLFMPLTGKDYSVVSDFRDVMITKAEEMLSKATDVYFVGYRGGDDLIHELLKKVPANTNLHIVGRDYQSTEDIFNSTSSRNKNLIRGKLYDKGFTDFVETFK
ncbi:MAG: hypothetical protein RLZZ455_852 [Candidatus Parcubacteria bacterium]|jgi:hypothetical protein